MLKLLAQLQRVVPGVLAVPAGHEVVEVAPAGLVTDAAVGQQLWELVGGLAAAQ